MAEPYNVVKQWVATRCPAQYIANFDGQLGVEIELALYIHNFMKGREYTLDNLDEAVRSFEAGVSLPGMMDMPLNASKLEAIVADPPYAGPDDKCAECGITLRQQQARKVHGTQARKRCDVCASMIDAVAGRPGLVRAQAEYEHENQRRIHYKRRLMGD